MPKRESLRVVHGGRPDFAQSPILRHPSGNCVEMLERADHYRSLAIFCPDEETTGLIDDMTDAIRALAGIESAGTDISARHSHEYRNLIAELEIEIMAALKRE